MEMLGGGCDADLPEACAALRRLLDGLDALIEEDTACVEAAVVCRSLPDDAGEEAVRAGIVALDAALTANASRGFEARLRAYPPVARLIDEIVQGEVGTVATSNHAGVPGT